ncbi:MAG: ketoacyl-ACP synthase III [Firmicutes bacterium]|nr:ketoacyl-ACP synthase III [Bacillota bacterium]
MINTRNVGITGTGSFVPEKILTNADLEKIVDTTDEWITTRTGIKERHVSDEKTLTSDMAAEAGRRAMEAAGITPDDVELILVATCSPDALIPSTACFTQDKLGCKNAGAFDLNAGCTGFIYGVSFASSLVASGAYNTILVIGAESLTKVLDWQDRNTCVLFGDGAGAAVIQPVEEGFGIIGHSLGSDGSGAAYIELPAGAAKLPASHETVDNRQHFIKMKGNDVFRFAVSIFDKISKVTLDKIGMTYDDIDLIVPHQANNRILEAAARKMKVGEDKIYSNLARFGNTSAASVPIALDEVVRNGKVKKGDNLLLVAFGAGLTYGSIVLKWAK